MADQQLINLIKSIKDSLSATIKLTLADGRVVQLECIYKESVAPNFYVVVPPRKMPDNIDIRKLCSLSFKDEGNNIPAVTAEIVEIPNDRSIELQAKKTIDPASLREYFRVDIRTEITISHELRSQGGEDRSWTMTGQTLDISGSGVLGLFPEKPRTMSNIFIELQLTHPDLKILCTGHVVRTRRLRGGNYHVALHYDNINQKNRDAIITNCLFEQRRQLRERIQI